jgi:hypothetical protein
MNWKDIAMKFFDKNIKCDQARDMLIDLVYQELDPSLAKELDAHLASCDACRGELGRLKLAKGALDKNLAQLGARVNGPKGMAPTVPLVAQAFEPVQSPLVAQAFQPVQSLHFQPAQAQPGKAVLPAGRTRRPIFFKAGLISAGAAVAAGLAIFFMVWLAQTPPASAQPGPVEIKKIGVSLTILSNPQDQDQYGGQERFVSYNQARQSSGDYERPQSLALIRDQRLIKNLPAGTSEIRFADVPTGILPESVRLHSLDRPDGLTILEQNYQYDLAWAGAILKKYIDKPLTITLKDNSSVTGKLLSFQAEPRLYDKSFVPIDGPVRCADPTTAAELPLAQFFQLTVRAELVIQPDGQGPRTIEPREIKAILAEKLPQGLLTRPTLVWQVQAAAAVQQQFEVAYLTHGLSWRADYMLKLRPGKSERPGSTGFPARGSQESQPGKAVPPDESQPGKAVLPGDIFDTADIVGYATVANNSGTTFEDAQLKLMAGDVHMVQPESLIQDQKVFLDRHEAKPGSDKGFEEKSFFEYHLYTLGRPATLKNSETKQIELLSADGVKMRRIYIYDPGLNATTAPAVASELVNSKANSMGMPLPKGMVRLYAPDPDGQDQFVAATPIDHTPADEKIRFVWGHAFDIVCSDKDTLVNFSGGGAPYGMIRQYDIRNHKDYDVKVTVVVHVPATASKGSCKVNGKDYASWTVPEVGRVEVEVPVKANEAGKVEFSFEANSASGGGLKPPAQRN